MTLKLALGIDIGGTNTVFGLIDREGNDYFIGSIPTHRDQPPDDLFYRLFLKLDEIKNQIKEDFELVGIGIGAPNANYYKKTIEYPPNLNWGYVVIENVIKKFNTKPIALTNDANAAALGEMYYGVAKGMKDFIVITLGTGLGSGIVVNGNLVYGHDGFAGEIGHTVVFHDGRQCGCGKEEIIIGYDLLNEPVAHYFDQTKLKPFLTPVYKKITKAICEVDTNHIIIYGGAIWDSDFSVFTEPIDPKAIYTFHKYWTPPTLDVIKDYIQFREFMNAPIWLGESGENTNEWINEFRQLLEKNNIGWCFWPYKKLKSERGIVSIKMPEGYEEIIKFALDMD